MLAREKRCIVDGIDSTVTVEPGLNAFYLHDLNAGLPSLDFEKYDTVLMLDIVEHLVRPELFFDQLRQAFATNPRAEIIVSTANVAFLVTRLMLLIGQFNYGRRGVLDLTHTRLFTFSSFERTIAQSGFDILERVGVPGPMPLALGDNVVSRFLLAVNKMLIHVSRGLFSYQIFLRIKPQPTLELLLKNAREESKTRAEALETAHE